VIQSLAECLTPGAVTPLSAILVRIWIENGSKDCLDPFDPFSL
jgi:hypothetical protein